MPEPEAPPSLDVDVGEAPDASADEDDLQLKIRIPNPRVYMEKQYSQWKGQRGRPRCDHCREKNLKCDRVQPKCNHCSLAPGRDCLYTPISIPAHRGIPRCDRCREGNLRCDRGYPTCNFCAETEDPASCNYSPKKRKLKHDPTVLVFDEPVPVVAGPAPAPTRAGPTRRPPLTAATDGECSDGGLYTDDEEAAEAPLLRLGASRRLRAQHILLALAVLSPAPHVQPWAHPVFAPLPRSIVARLGRVRIAEMPARAAFEDALARFVGSLSPGLREAAVLPLETYVKLTQALTDGSWSDHTIAPELRSWAMIDHVKPGSAKHHRLIALKDEWFWLDAAEEEARRRAYLARADAELALGAEEPFAEWCAPFARVPVQPQLYDLLAWAHRCHNSAPSMVKECMRVGFATITWPMAELFVRLCPLCGQRPSAPREIHRTPSGSATTDHVLS